MAREAAQFRVLGSQEGGPTDKFRRLYDLVVDLKLAARHDPLCEVSAAILRRALVALRELGDKGSDAFEVEVRFRAETPLEVVTGCRARFEKLFKRRRAFDLGLVCSGKGDKPLEEDPYLLTPDTWDRMEGRLLSTKPSFRSQNSGRPRGWHYALKLRAGERGLLVPGTELTVEEMLRDPSFQDRLISRSGTSTGASLEDPAYVHVDGKYLSENQLNLTYHNRPTERAAAMNVDRSSGEGLAPDLLTALQTGDFSLFPMEGRPHELMPRLRALAKDSAVRWVVSSDPHSAHLGEVDCYRPGAGLFGFYGVSRATGENAKAPDVGLYCPRDYSNGGSGLVKVEHVLLLNRG